MKYNMLNLQSYKNSKRVGRGIAGGQGKTAGRGTKGQNSRAGSSKKPGFEGGQNPLMQRLPKLKGFHSAAIKNTVVYTGQLEKLEKHEIDTSVLAEAGIIPNPHLIVKLLVKGTLTKKLHVKLPAASAAAIAQIQSKDGIFEPTPRLPRPVTSKRTANIKGKRPVKTSI